MALVGKGRIGEAVAQVYVHRFFPAEAKEKMQDLVANVKAAMRTRLQNLEWMSPETKQAALTKLDQFGAKIGYPDKWRDYSAMTIEKGDAYGNTQRAAEFEAKRRLVRLGQKTDRTEWGMTPQTVNASYNSVFNEITFPAAILQPPFFDPNADPAVNYGGIGAVIGHEMGHGFDDQGSKCDGEGMLCNWWTDDDAAAFKVRLEHSDTTSAGDFTAITGGGFTDIGNAAYVGSVAISKDDAKRYLRINIYEETGTASSIISVTGFGVKKYQ